MRCYLLTHVQSIAQFFADLADIAALIAIAIGGILHAILRLAGWTLRHLYNQHFASDTANHAESRRERFIRHALGVSSHRSDDLSAFRDIRVGVGRSLTMGLEFLLASDLIHTIISFMKPWCNADAAMRWHELGLLATITGIRTALSFFLQQEIRNEEQMNDMK